MPSFFDTVIPRLGYITLPCLPYFLQTIVYRLGDVHCFVRLVFFILSQVLAARVRLERTYLQSHLKHAFPCMASSLQTLTHHHGRTVLRRRSGRTIFFTCCAVEPLLSFLPRLGEFPLLSLSLHPYAYRYVPIIRVVGLLGQLPFSFPYRYVPMPIPIDALLS